MSARISPELSYVQYDSFVGPDEVRAISYTIADRGCTISARCLECPLVVCIHDTLPNGKEIGSGRAIRKTWPNRDWPARLDALAKQGEPNDQSNRKPRPNRYVRVADRQPVLVQ